jgi:hypothetical protein
VLFALGKYTKPYKLLIPGRFRPTVRIVESWEPDQKTSADLNLEAPRKLGKTVNLIIQREVQGTPGLIPSKKWKRFAG